MDTKSRNFRRPAVVAGSAVCFLLCLVLIIMKGYTVRLCSDSGGVEFITEGETVTRVNIHGQFPFLSIVPGFTESRVTDAKGNVTEETRIYTVEAEFALNRQMSMHLDIEASDDMVRTYILKFADRDIKIVNGKVVE